MEIDIFRVCISQYLFTSVLNHTKKSVNLKHLSTNWVGLLQQYSGGNSLWLTEWERKIFPRNFLVALKNRK